MYHAEAKHSFGYRPVAKQHRTKKTAQTDGRFRRLDEKDKGRKGSSAGQAEVGCHSYPSDAFLKYTFAPRVAQVGDISRIADIHKMESGFYASLDLLAEHYGITPRPIENAGYPLNIALSYRNICEQLRRLGIFDFAQIVSERGSTYIQTVESCQRGGMLYYIPILPLHRLLEDGTDEDLGNLLLSIYTYLYNCLQIPSYNSGYLDGIYDMLSDQYAYDGEEEDGGNFAEEVEQVRYVGRLMEKRMADPANLEGFPLHLERYAERKDADGEMVALARRVLSLYQGFPDRSIFDRAQTFTPQQYDDYVVTMDMYISFCAEVEGELADAMTDLVNCLIQEYNYLQVPQLVRKFDGRSSGDESLDFENTVFDVLDELVYQVNKLKSNR